MCLVCHNYKTDIDFTRFGGSRWPRRLKLTFKLVGRFAPHRFESQFELPGPPGLPKVDEIKIEFKICNKPHK